MSPVVDRITSAVNGGLRAGVNTERTRSRSPSSIKPDESLSHTGSGLSFVERGEYSMVFGSIFNPLSCAFQHLCLGMHNRNVHFLQDGVNIFLPNFLIIDPGGIISREVVDESCITYQSSAMPSWLWVISNSSTVIMIIIQHANTYSLFGTPYTLLVSLARSAIFSTIKALIVSSELSWTDTGSLSTPLGFGSDPKGSPIASENLGGGVPVFVS